jgi:hypothetical protein
MNLNGKEDVREIQNTAAKNEEAGELYLLLSVMMSMKSLGLLKMNSLKLLN